MNFDYSEDQLMIQQMTQDFAKKEILPNINVWDEKQYFPIELFKKAGQQGLMGVLVPEKFGGSGLGYEEYILVIKEISKVCGAIGLSLAAHNSLCVNHLLKFGNDNQKNKIPEPKKSHDSKGQSISGQILTISFSNKSCQKKK